LLLWQSTIFPIEKIIIATTFSSGILLFFIVPIFAYQPLFLQRDVGLLMFTRGVDGGIHSNSDVFFRIESHSYHLTRKDDISSDGEGGGEWE
jgi:hypothetical protein